MSDGSKTKAELVAEAAELRQRITELEASTAQNEQQISGLIADQERLRRLFENAPLSYQSLDVDGCFMEVNRAWLSLLGYTRQEVIGKWFGDFLGPHDQEAFRHRFPCFKRDGAVNGVEFEMLHKDGTTVTVMFNGQIGYNVDGSFRQTHCIMQDVTARKQAEEEIADLAKFPSENPHPVLRVASDGRIIYANTAGKKMLEEQPETDLAQASPRWREVLTKVLEFDSPTELEEQSGDRILSLVFAPVVDSGYVNIYGHDITERKRAEEARRESGERYRTLVDRNPHGIQEIDVSGTIIFANEAHHRMYGYESGQGLIGRSIIDFLASESQRIELSGHLALLVKDQPPPIPYYQTILTTQGVERDIEVVWNYLRDADGCVTGFMSVLTDITERKRAEEERRALEAQIQHAQKLESLGVLAGGIAHDFNNLLMAILGNADLALTDLSRVSPVRENLLEIKKASQRAAELAKQMLAYSGKGKFVIELLDLSEVVEEMAHILEVSVSKKAILKYNFADNLPPFEGDATQVRQVIMNLITNASEAIGDRSGIISISVGAMQADRTYLRETYLDENLPEGMYVTLEVADTGCGMDDETRGKLFDPFFTTKFTGRGLGMAAVLGIVRGHSGAVKIYSEMGKGTTMRVLFPAVEGKIAAMAKRADAVADWRGSGTVLLVDDEETVRAVGAMMLKRLGMTVIPASDGREAVDIFAHRSDEIDCVILDLTMPHMDGEQAYRELRRIDPEVHVIMSSGYNEQDVTQRFVGKGLAGFIQKPYELEKLVAILRKTLEA
jgi:PAS domain S-box-containing protein